MPPPLFLALLLLLLHLLLSLSFPLTCGLLLLRLLELRLLVAVVMVAVVMAVVVGGRGAIGTYDKPETLSKGSTKSLPITSS